MEKEKNIIIIKLWINFIITWIIILILIDLKIHIFKFLEEHYTNPLNMIFDIYFSSFKRICDELKIFLIILNFLIFCYF